MISPNLVCALILWKSSLGLLTGKYRQILKELAARPMTVAGYYRFTFLFFALMICFKASEKFYSCSWNCIKLNGEGWIFFPTTHTFPHIVLIFTVPRWDFCCSFPFCLSTLLSFYYYFILFYVLFVLVSTYFVTCFSWLLHSTTTKPSLFQS